MKRRILPWLAIATIIVLTQNTTFAAVVVIQNGSAAAVTFTIEHAGTAAENVRLDVGESKAINVGKQPLLKTTLGGKEASFHLEPYQAYLFGIDGGKLGFGGIELIAPMPKVDDVPEKPVALKPLRVPVNLYADNKDHRAKPAWEKAYRQRLGEASAIIERDCGVTFFVNDTGEWGPTDAEPLLPSLFGEFETTAKAPVDGLALGYTLRVPKPKLPNVKPKPDPDAPPPMLVPQVYGRNGLPWQSHVLMRDELPGTEGERIEVLVHQLGWHIGAVTSPDNDTVMRVNLDDGRATNAKHRVSFDPLNMLIVHIWAEEIRAGKGRTWRGLRPQAAARLYVLYRTLAKIQPDEIVIGDYVAALDLLTDAAPLLEAKPVAKLTDKEVAIRAVVQAVTARCVELTKLPTRPKDDALTTELVRAAAVAANKLDASVKASAFLTGVGIALDESTILRANPLTKSLCLAVESEDERKLRLGVLGSPTLRSRRDLCQHFAVSMALTDLVTPAGAELAGLAKELADMKGPSGFSFQDLTADLAGIELAKVILADPKRLEKLCDSFATDDYLPPTKGLPDGLTADQFSKAYGSTEDQRFKDEVAGIRKAIATLPTYKK